MDNELDHYIASHSDPEGEYLHRLWRATNVATVHGRMASGHVEGRLLRLLVMMARPRTVVEVGTFTGYSAICMAEGLAQLAAEDGDHSRRLYTFEVNDELDDFTRRWIDGSAVGRYIDFRIGDAAQLAPRMGVEFDMAFIDGDKRTYTETLEALLPAMAPGAWLLADNTLWDGHVVDPAYDRDAQTMGIRRFNDHVATHPALERVIVPLRDGLTIIRKRTLSNL